MITPNTARRDCIDRIVISDSSETRTALTKPKSALRFNGNFIEIPLSRSDKDKFQAGEIFVNVFEPANDGPVNATPLRFNLLGPKPALTKFTIRQGDKIGRLEGTGLGEIESLSVNGEPVASFESETGDVILASHIKGFTANLSGKLRAGDTLSKSFSVVPTADIINGRLDCDTKNSSSSITAEIKTAYRPYTFSNCVIPVDTDALNLVLISKEPYQFRSAQKPALILEVEKEALRFETIQNLGPLGEVKNNRRMDTRIPITQPIKDWLMDGKKLYLRFVDKDFGESKRYEFAIEFAMLPKNLTLDCRVAEGRECELAGDVGVIAQASTDAENGSTKWVNAELSDTKLRLPKLGYENFFLIRLRSNSSQIKIDLKDLRNTSIKYFEAPPEQLDISLR